MRPDPGHTDRDRELLRAMRGLLREAGEGSSLTLVTNGVGWLALTLTVRVGNDIYDNRVIMDHVQTGPSRALWMLERSFRDWKAALPCS